MKGLRRAGKAGRQVGREAGRQNQGVRFRKVGFNGSRRLGPLPPWIIRSILTDALGEPEC